MTDLPYITDQQLEDAFAARVFRNKADKVLAAIDASNVADDVKADAHELIEILLGARERHVQLMSELEPVLPIVMQQLQARPAR